MLAIALVIAACSSPSTAAVTTPPPTVTPSPTPQPLTPAVVGRLEPKDFTVGITALPGPNEANARKVFAGLVIAWHQATGGRSRVTPYYGGDGARDIYVVFVNERSTAVGAIASGRVVVVPMPPPGTPDDWFMMVVLHEVGHALGCCRGDGTSDGHWIGCPPSPPWEFMCPGQVSVSTFSERELAQMGLAAR